MTDNPVKNNDNESLDDKSGKNTREISLGATTETFVKEKEKKRWCFKISIRIINRTHRLFTNRY